MRDFRHLTIKGSQRELNPDCTEPEVSFPGFQIREMRRSNPKGSLAQCTLGPGMLGVVDYRCFVAVGPRQNADSALVGVP